MNHATVSLWMALGTATGGMLRYGVAQSIATGDAFPWSTLIVNALGSLLIGWIAGRATDPGSRLAHAHLHAFWVPGFCAGLTTFSVFSQDTMRLLQSGTTGAGIANITTTLLLMLAATALGLTMAPKRSGHRD
ncbi:fluoride efflux transporter FluC [Halomonadaceae bacterium KBTZ08]